MTMGPNAKHGRSHLMKRISVQLLSQKMLLSLMLFLSREFISSNAEEVECLTSE